MPTSKDDKQRRRRMKPNKVEREKWLNDLKDELDKLSQDPEFWEKEQEDRKQLNQVS